MFIFQNTSFFELIPVVQTKKRGVSILQLWFFLVVGDCCQYLFSTPTTNLPSTAHRSMTAWSVDDVNAVSACP